MKPLQIAALTAATINVLVTLLVLRASFRAPTTGAYTIWGIALTLWNVGTYFALSALPHDEAVLWVKVLQLGVIFLPVSMLHLCFMLTGAEHRRLIGFLYCCKVGFALSLTGDWFVRDVREISAGHWMEPGRLFWVFLVFFVVECGAVIAVIAHARRHAEGLRRKQLLFMLVACAILTVCGTNDLLPIFGRDEYLPGLPFKPLGNLAANFYALVVAYSLLQHQFLSVHVSLGRTAAQTVRLIFVFGIGLVLLLITAALAPKDLISPFAFAATLVIVLVSAAIASFAFPRLFGRGDEALERRIFGDLFEHHDRVRSFVENMVWYDHLDALFDDLHTLLFHTLGIRSYKFILRDEVLRAFTVHRMYPPDDSAALPELKLNSAIFQYFEWTKSEYLALDAKYSRTGERNIGRLARRQFTGLGAEFCFPLTSQLEPFGLLLVGPKEGGAEYSGTDIAMLVSVVKNLSLVVNQIRLKVQIRQNQDFELLGKMSRGMAHDLNNLLTPVSTLLQLSSEPGHDAALNSELLPVALRNVRTMRAYIKESLFFSENMRPSLHLDRLDEVVHEAAETARTSREKTIDLVVETPEPLEIEMDAVLLQRLIVNLISNAIDASQPGASVRVRLDRLSRSEAHCEWVRLRVIDQGEGISKENLSRVLTPYFTTKNRGDSNRGFGLGLAISRKIVNMHGGNLSIASQLKKGTTVQVDLPSRQISEPMPPAVTPA